MLSGDPVGPTVMATVGASLAGRRGGGVAHRRTHEEVLQILVSRGQSPEHQRQLRIQARAPGGHEGIHVGRVQGTGVVQGDEAVLDRLELHQTGEGVAPGVESNGPVEQVR
jgi:hypothetical protein